MFWKIEEKLSGTNLKFNKNLKTQRKNSKLKQKTQGPGGYFRAWGTKWCYKKSLAYTNTTTLYSRIFFTSFPSIYNMHRPY